MGAPHDLFGFDAFFCVQVIFYGFKDTDIALHRAADLDGTGAGHHHLDHVVGSRDSPAPDDGDFTGFVELVDTADCDWEDRLSREPAIPVAEHRASEPG